MNIKKISRLIIIAILIIGFYYAAQVEPAAKKRIEVAVDNFQSLNSFSFLAKLELEDAREGFYDLNLNGKYDASKVTGTYNLLTRIKGTNQEIEGNYIYDTKNENLFISFTEDGLPITLEKFFARKEINIETARASWIMIPFKLSDFQFVKKDIEVISEQEEINGKEMYEYAIAVNTDLFEDALEAVVSTGKENLYLHRIKVEEEVTLARNLHFEDPFPKISQGSSPTLLLEIDFSNFNSEEVDINLPEKFIKL